MGAKFNISTNKSTLSSLPEFSEFKLLFRERFGDLHNAGSAPLTELVDRLDDMLYRTCICLKAYYDYIENIGNLGHAIKSNNLQLTKSNIKTFGFVLQIGTIDLVRSIYLLEQHLRIDDKSLNIIILYCKQNNDYEKFFSQYGPYRVFFDHWGKRLKNKQSKHVYTTNNILNISSNLVSFNKGKYYPLYNDVENFLKFLYATLEKHKVEILQSL